MALKYWYEESDVDRHGVPKVAYQDDPAGKLAEMAANTQFEDLPDDVVETMKKAMLDTMAVMIGGSSRHPVPEANEVIKKRWGGMGESKTLIFGTQAPAAEAAIVNGTMGRALDFGDVHNTGGHLSEYIIPAMLSALPLADGKVSGKDFITAYVVGAEWGSRQHTCCRFQYHPLGMPGACAWAGITPAVARMLGLNKDQIWSAEGFSYTAHSMGEQQKVFEGCDAQRLHHGFFGSQAIFASELARAGLTGVHGIYYGECGMLRYVDWDDVEPEILTKDLGTYWHWVDGLTIKPFASCKFTHCVVSAAIKLREQYNIDYHDIESIHCIVARNAGPTIQPSRWNPQDAGAAMFSIPYAISHALMYGDVFMDAFEEKELFNPEKRELMKHVTVEISDDPNIGIFDGYTTEIHMKDGTVHSMVEWDIMGGPTCPMTWKQMEGKFWKCVPYSAVELPKEKLERIVWMCENLEQVEDMNEFVENLTL